MAKVWQKGYSDKIQQNNIAYLKENVDINSFADLANRSYNIGSVEWPLLGDALDDLRARPLGDGVQAVISLPAGVHTIDHENPKDAYPFEFANGEIVMEGAGIALTTIAFADDFTNDWTSGMISVSGTGKLTLSNLRVDIDGFIVTSESTSLDVRNGGRLRMAFCETGTSNDIVAINQGRITIDNTDVNSDVNIEEECRLDSANSFFRAVNASNGSHLEISLATFDSSQASAIFVGHMSTGRITNSTFSNATNAIRASLGGRVTASGLTTGAIVTPFNPALDVIDYSGSYISGGLAALSFLA